MLHIALTLLALGVQEQGDGSRVAVDLQKLAYTGAQQSTIRMYEVRDLLDPTVVDFAPPQLGMLKEPPPKPVPAQPVDPARANEPAPEPTREDWMRATETLAATILRHVQPPIGATAKPATMGAGSIAMSATLEQHEWIGEFLRAQRDFHGSIVIETQIFTLPNDALAHLRVANGTTLANPRERDDFVARAKLEPDVELLTAPMLQVHPRQRANIAVLDQISFVQDWSIDIVEPGAKEIADPQIGVINEGLVVDVRAMPVPGDAILTELGINFCKVKKPIQTTKVRIGKAQSFEVEVALPEVDTQTIRSDVVFADGASVVLVLPKATEQRALLAVVGARRARN